LPSSGNIKNKENSMSSFINKLTNVAHNRKENDFFKQKEKWIESLFGKSLNNVYHSIVPYSVGGALDMYVYPNHIPGTGFVTFEISEHQHKECQPNKYGFYELAIFTRLNNDEQKESDFQKKLLGFRHLLTVIARYSTEAILNPLETLEIPIDENKPYACLILDYYPNNNATVIDKQKLHLLTMIEIYRSEMEYAMKFGGINLINKLKEVGYYPYSDLERNPVV
jgi:hypothetical protein